MSNDPYECQENACACGRMNTSWDLHKSQLDESFAEIPVEESIPVKLGKKL